MKLVALCAALLARAAAEAAQPPLSDYLIVLATDATAIEARAAAAFANFSGLAVAAAPGPDATPRIAIGAGAAQLLAPGAFSPDVLAALGDEGFCLDLVGVDDPSPPLLVASGGEGAARGSLYAAYALLEVKEGGGGGPVVSRLRTRRFGEGKRAHKKGNRRGAGDGVYHNMEETACVL